MLTKEEKLRNVRSLPVEHVFDLSSSKVYKAPARTLPDVDPDRVRAVKMKWPHSAPDRKHVLLCDGVDMTCYMAGCVHVRACVCVYASVWCVGGCACVALSLNHAEHVAIVPTTSTIDTVCYFVCHLRRSPFFTPQRTLGKVKLLPLELSSLSHVYAARPYCSVACHIAQVPYAETHCVPCRAQARPRHGVYSPERQGDARAHHHAPGGRTGAPGMTPVHSLSTISAPPSPFLPTVTLTTFARFHYYPLCTLLNTHPFCSLSLSLSLSLSSHTLTPTSVSWATRC